MFTTRLEDSNVADCGEMLGCTLSLMPRKFELHLMYFLPRVTFESLEELICHYEPMCDMTEIDLYIVEFWHGK